VHVRSAVVVALVTFRAEIRIVRIVDADAEDHEIGLDHRQFPVNRWQRNQLVVLAPFTPFAW
jgi:hypothetical protein